jgi:membrane associated rhomboid family serine protease
MFVLPVNRDKPPVRTAYVTKALIVLNSAIWVILAFTGLNSHAALVYGFRPGHWTFATLFASMFLHAGLFHVAGNMWFLWMFAPKLEERLGSAKFLLAYLVSGVGAAALHAVVEHGSMVPLVGASGAISGVAGMYFVLFPRSPFELILYFGWWIRKSFNAQTRGAVGVWIGEQFVLGLITSSIGSSTVAFWAHVGGFITGIGIAAAVASSASDEEKAEILRPKPLTEEEREEIFADRMEQASDLTTLKLNG